MPRIDWFEEGDDQPRWEPRQRRERVRREPRWPRTRIFTLGALASVPPVLPEPPVRRPLHLIWGPPNRTEGPAPIDPAD